ncbi:MAG TPA: peptidoglycan-binding domain-containing protein [Acidimicrobiales bacterium]
MASNTGAVILVVVALAAIGFAADGQDDAGSRDDDAGEVDRSDGSDACDGVTVVQSASGSAELPAGESWTESSVECDIAEGGDGEAVRALQDALVRCNDQDIAVDGEYGEQTRAAVARVEALSGLEADGVYDPATREAMRWPVTSASGETTCVTDVSSDSASDGG